MLLTSMLNGLSVEGFWFTQKAVTCNIFERLGKNREEEKIQKTYVKNMLSQHYNTQLLNCIKTAD